MKPVEKHIFAIYHAQLSSFIRPGLKEQSILIEDPQLALRLSSVLRLRQGEECILFDRMVHAVCVLQEITKKMVKCEVKNVQQNISLQPSITFILPLLKKDDFETALYSLVELGASTIQIVTTQKTKRSWGGEKEFERAQRIMIAAAEQSKNYAVPELKGPIALSALIDTMSKSAASKIYFDPDGQHALDVIQSLENKKQEIILMVGPEGDLTMQEKDLLQKDGFTFCALTPTILRSVQASAVSLGMFRVVFQEKAKN